MEEIEGLRHALGSAAERINDTQLRLLSRELDLAADFLLDLHAHEHSMKKPELITRVDGTSTIRTMKERSNKPMFNGNEKHYSQNDAENRPTFNA